VIIVSLSTEDCGLDTLPSRHIQCGGTHKSFEAFIDHWIDAQACLALADRPL
jgi:hypothetical protein